MMSWTINGRPISVTFDASISESHLGSAQVTEHQVETGSNIADHVRALPLRLSVQAMVSDTPTLEGGSVLKQSVPTLDRDSIVLTASGEVDRVRTIYNALTDAMQAGVLIEVNTSLRKYTNLAIINLATPRNALDSNAVTFSIDLLQVRLVKTFTVASLPEKAKGARKRGAKSNKDLDNEPKKKEQVKQSFLKTITAG
jgi:hypothetical protein